ncbi:MAG: DUF4301 family protein [Smithella sp.]|jgi:hypothetical protein
MKKAHKNKLSFFPKDIRQIKRLGLDLITVEKQLALHRQGPTFLKLKRPCAVKDGIFSFTPAQRKKLISFYEEQHEKHKLIKFVPASGAASRMFAEWFNAGENGSFGAAELDRSFLKNLTKYPFFDLIEQNNPGRKFIDEKSIGGLLNHVLSSDGLNFAGFPKALIPFHRYSSGEIRTSLDEHICEASQYVRDKNDTCHIHFTLSPGFKNDVIKYLKTAFSKYEKLYKVKYKISLSVQESSTGTIAVDKNNRPFRDEHGRIVFRPGGHGTLLGNLNKLNADFIFVKNIDNVAPENLWEDIIPYKKMIGGLAIQVQQEIFTSLRVLENTKISPAQIEKIAYFCATMLSIIFPGNFSRQSQKEKIKFLLSVLNRPLRVCGMVKNENEPGGGPFWVEENDGALTLQIVENVHVDKRKKNQSRIWSQAGYFNPVDMVCGIKNYQGKKFNLFNYVNNEAYLITAKSEKGREIKALEVPGLWNGSMAYWNTIFVKMPFIVFNPVKTVNDLLRPEHSIP